MRINQSVSDDMFWQCMTIADRVLFMFDKQEWVTTTEFLNAGLYTFTQRLSNLRKQGFIFDEQRIECKSTYRYRLVFDPRKEVLESSVLNGIELHVQLAKGIER